MVIIGHGFAACFHWMIWGEIGLVVDPFLFLRCLELGLASCRDLVTQFLGR